MKIIITVIFLSLQFARIFNAGAATFTISPSTADCNEEFENIANSLKPGDELVLRGGTYSQNCRRAIALNGTASQPIVIRAAEGETPIVTRPVEPNFSYANNNIEISGSFFTIRGLHFKGGDAGVRILSGVHHMTFEDNEIYETGNNAMPINDGNTDSLTIRRNHIHHTGLNTASSTEGEGIYLGCNNASCRATNTLIEGNHIHHLRGTTEGGNDGIEVKVGSGGNIIRNNVIHNTNIGMQYPCIFVYGGGTSVNTVEGNVMWNCGEGIQVASDAVVRNNIIINSSVAGIYAAPHAQVAQMRNVTIVNNTIYGHPKCLYIRWSGATNMILANNAVYCPGSTSIDASGLTGAGITIRSNYLEGSLAGATIDNTRFFSGGSAASAFVSPSGLDFWPASGSILVGRGDPSAAPPLDFNERTRNAPHDGGAYETDGLAANPGWKIAAGFKTTTREQVNPPAAPTNLQVR